MRSISDTSPEEARYNQLLKCVFCGDDLHHGEWMMNAAERATLTHLVSIRQPDVCIEVGTHQGGSLRPLARYSKQVISIDIDPNVVESLKSSFTNVDFRTGDSQQILPQILEQLADEDAALGFVLVDGNHSREGVRTDLNNLLAYTPREPLYIVCHDSGQPECRLGMQEANWHDNPYVHYVELDFVPGVLASSPQTYRQMWSGFALGVMLPEKRKGDLEIGRYRQLQFETLFRKSIHSDITTVLKCRVSKWRETASKISWLRRMYHSLR